MSEISMRRRELIPKEMCRGEGKDMKPSSANTSADRHAADVDRLEYLSDMILELQQMAVQCRCTTLAGILALAHNEARQATERASSR